VATKGTGKEPRKQDSLCTKPTVPMEVPERGPLRFRQAHGECAPPGMGASATPPSSAASRRPVLADGGSRRLLLEAAVRACLLGWADLGHYWGSSIMRALLAPANSE
jgi:hypothetical protein